MRKNIHFKVLYLKSLILPIFCFIFIFCLIVYSETSVNAALRGINLWLNVVFPSLFPFFVGADLLNKSGIFRAIGIFFEPIMRPLFNVPGCGSFAFIMGVTSGYPVGAKLTTSMREEKMISKADAERLLAFTNNSGPLFIIGAVAVGMFNQQKLGLFLLTCHILSCITVGIIFGLYSRHRKTDSSYQNEKKSTKLRSELLKLRSNKDFGSMFGNAIKDSIMTVLAIGGFIIFFSVVISLLLELGVISAISGYISVVLAPLGISANLVSSVISGLFEITTGINMASKAADATIIQKLTATSAIIGWAGFSVHFQVMSIVRKADISIKPYLIGKFIQGLIAACYTYIVLKFFNLHMIEDAPAFIPWEDSNNILFNLSNKYVYKYHYASLAFLLFTISGVLLLCIIKKKGWRY